MSALDDQIDDLYQLPLAEFTAARNALAKTLSGDDRQRVKALGKPSAVSWAVNQVHWRARGVYDRLLKAGDRLRRAQIAALEGKSADVRGASESHRHAIAEAVREAERAAAAAGSKPSADALARSFEALSLAAEPPEPHGRLTEALQPAGFEALAGVVPGKLEVKSKKSEVEGRKEESRKAGHKEHGGRTEDARPTREERRAAEKAEREQEARAAAARQREAELKRADAAVARAEAHEKLARETWERAHDALLEARKARDEIRRTKLS